MTKHVLVVIAAAIVLPSAVAASSGQATERRILRNATRRAAVATRAG